MAKSKPKTNKKADSNDWLIPFMKLREKLRALVYGNVPLYHAAFLSNLNGTTDVSEIVDVIGPNPDVKLLEAIPVFRIGDVWVRHYFSRDGKAALDSLQKLLLDLDEWLKYVPIEVLPQIGRLPIRKHATANLMKWIGILYHLAGKYRDDDLVIAETGCFDSLEDVDCYFWGESPSSTKCDPIPYLTRMPRQDEKLDLWAPGKKSGERKYPEIVTACLVGDVLQMSMHAVVLLKYYGTKPPATAEIVDTTGDGHYRKGGDKEVLSDKILRETKKLWKGVIAHHFPKDGPVNRKPLAQTKMAVEIMGWSKKQQYVISRRLAIVFSTCKKGKPCREAVRVIYKAMVKEGSAEDFMACWANITREGLIGHRAWKEYSNQKKHDPQDRSGDDEDEE